MMDHIVMKKRGRPSKADLACRSDKSLATSQPDLRRSLRRRRNVSYNIDYLNKEDEDQEEDEKRHNKKLKLVVKFNNNEEKDKDEDDYMPSHRGERGVHASYENEVEKEEQEEKEEEGNEEAKKYEEEREVTKWSAENLSQCLPHFFVPIGP